MARGKGFYRKSGDGRAVETESQWGGDGEMGTEWDGECERKGRGGDVRESGRAMMGQGGDMDGEETGREKEPIMEPDIRKELTYARPI